MTSQVFESHGSMPEREGIVLSPERTHLLLAASAQSRRAKSRWPQLGPYDPLEESEEFRSDAIRLVVAVYEKFGTRPDSAEPRPELYKDDSPGPTLADLENLQRAASLAAQESLEFTVEQGIGLIERRGDRLVRVYPDGTAVDEGPADSWWENLDDEEPESR